MCAPARDTCPAAIRSRQARTGGRPRPADGKAEKRQVRVSSMCPDGDAAAGSGLNCARHAHACSLPSYPPVEPREVVDCRERRRAAHDGRHRPQPPVSGLVAKHARVPSAPPRVARHALVREAGDAVCQQLGTVAVDVLHRRRRLHEKRPPRHLRRAANPKGRRKGKAGSRQRHARGTQRCRQPPTEHAGFGLERGSTRSGPQQAAARERHTQSSGFQSRCETVRGPSLARGCRATASLALTGGDGERPRCHIPRTDVPGTPPEEDVSGSAALAGVETRRSTAALHVHR